MRVPPRPLRPLVRLAVGMLLLACRPTYAASPPLTFESAAAYDPIGDRMIVTGGIVQGTSTALDEVWALATGPRAEWTFLGRLDSARSHHSLTYDPVRRRLLLFGGDDLRTTFGSVLAFDLVGGGGWTPLATTGGPVIPRSDHVAVYDPANDRLVVHGGQNRLARPFPEFSDTWCLWLGESPARWELLTTVGDTGPRRSHVGVYDSRRRRLIVHSGFNTDGTTWALPLDPTGVWTDITPPGTSADDLVSLHRFESAAQYDSLTDRLWMFGGNVFQSAADANDVWALGFTPGDGWTRFAPAGAPKPRREHALVLDPQRSRLFSIGSVAQGDQQLLALDLPAASEWSFQPPLARLETAQIVLPPVTVGDTLRTSVRISNFGIEPLEVQGAEGGTPEFQVVSRVPYVLDGWRASHVDIFEFVPVLPRQQVDSLFVLSNDAQEPRRALALLTTVLPITVQVGALGRPDTLPLGRAFVMVLRPAPSVHVRSAMLYHRAAGTSAPFDSLAFAALSADLVATVPAEAVTERGLEYFVVARNGAAAALQPAGAPLVTQFQAVRPASELTVVARPNSGADIVEGAPVRVQVSLPLGTIAQDGNLHYRVGGESAAVAVPLVPSIVGGWEAEIPGAAIGARGVEYRVVMRTLADSLREPSSGGFTALAVRVQGLLEPLVHAAGRYRLLSLPLTSLRPDVGLDDILSGALGTYDRKRWRAFALEPGTSPGYHELSRTGDAAFAPDSGRRAFWLITRDAHRLDTGPIPALSLDPSRPVSIPLVTGWNLIGDPFPFEVPWSQVQDEAGTVTDVRRFDPASGRAGGYAPGRPAALLPFDGCFVRASGPTVLHVDPRPAPLANTSPNAKTAEPGWDLRLALHGELADDTDNHCGEQRGAGFAARDRHEPPTAPGDWVRLAFVAPGNSQERLCADLREPSAEGQLWELELASSRAGEALRFEMTPGSTRHPAWALFDRERGVLLATSPAGLDTSAGGTPVSHGVVSRGTVPYRLALAVGSATFVSQAFTGGEPGLEPLALAAPSPNPARLATWLGFTLPAAGAVQLEVLDVSGRRIWSHASGPLPTGRHGVVWDARGPGGRAAPGIYLVRLVAGGRRFSRRLVLLP
ncbi:MAG: hypothetical protein ABL977_00635 [Candidatus Eisenbacteria bacterium]